MTRLAIEGLTKRFGDVVAVETLDLGIDNHEFISLLGPSGCGKTTTLRCIAGFEQPSAGRITFDGTDIVDRLPEDRNIGMVFQNYALFPHMTVRENLAFGLEMRKIQATDRQARIDRVLDIVQLGGLGDRYPRQLSGGQQQRVALARAIVIEPAILLLDEPLANLDAKLREEMRFFIRSLQQEVGITTVYVTHDQGEAMVMSDRIVVMFDGAVHQIGTPTDIYDRPTTHAVANFIGQSNFIAAEIKGRDSDGIYRLETSLGPLSSRFSGTLERGQRVDLLVRPEAIELTSDGIVNGANLIAAELQERYFLGNTLACRLKGSDGSVLAAQAPPWLDLGVGEPIGCRFAPERTWLIPK